MEDARFYYSADGIEVKGPVPKSALRRLFRDQAINPTSLLCREGETKWQRLDPDEFRKPDPLDFLPPVPGTIPPPDPRPVPLSLVVPPRPQDSTFRMLLKASRYVTSTGAAIILTVYPDPAAPSSNADPGISQTGAFCGNLLVLAGLPSLVSLAFPKSYRIHVQAIGIVLLAALVLGGRLASTGAQDARIDDDLLAVDHDLEKLDKDAYAADAVAGDFDPTTIQSLQDISSQRAARAATVAFLEDFDTHCRNALAKDKFRPETVSQVIAKAHQANHIDQILVRCRLTVKLSNDMLSILDYLEKNWGALTDENGRKVFNDPSILDGYRTLSDAVDADISQINSLKDPFKKDGT